MTPNIVISTRWIPAYAGMTNVEYSIIEEK
jgi:hypothetical protein